MHPGSAVEAAWHRLRATRWHPPANAVITDDRRATYGFALEQAEQMFRAASTVGPATRPLLLFYGLSQAGRAVAAAASHDDDGAWKLSGHGINAHGLTKALPDIEIATGKKGDRGSFVRLSELLGSPIWHKAHLKLNVLWDLIPENERSPLVESGAARRTPLWIADRFSYSEPHPLASVAVVGFPPSVVTAVDRRARFDEFVAAFPNLQVCDSYKNSGPDNDHLPEFDLHVDGWGELITNWMVDAGRSVSMDERARFMDSITRPYLGRRYFFPVVTADRVVMHPLMTWWAVLHALSMLARYQPAEWAAHIDVDKSRYAVAIEVLLTDALNVLPRLVLETIEEVS